jgi:hypothetical protein
LPNECGLANTELVFFRLEDRMVCKRNLAVLVVLGLSGIATAAPSVFWASDPVRPDESVIVEGAGFGSSPHVLVTRIGATEPSQDAQPDWRKATDVDVIQADAQSFKFTLPSRLQPGMFAVKVHGENGDAEFLLNRPTVYWAQGDLGTSASPKGWVRVFGRAMGHGSKVFLGLRSLPSGKEKIVVGVSAGEWEAKFSLPAEVAPGMYEMRFHSGWGGVLGWSKAGQIEVRNSEPWPNHIFDVRLFGAKGTGATDDSAAVAEALRAAHAGGGGVVYFPRGRYQLSKTLEVPRNVTLRGESRTVVSLTWTNFNDPPRFLIKGSNHFAVEDLTLHASNYTEIIGGDLSPTKDGPPGDAHLARVTIRANRYRGHPKPEEVDAIYRSAVKADGDGGDAVQLGGANISVVDCDIYSSARPLFLWQPKGAYVAHNHLYTGRMGWYSITGADGVIIEDNEIVGADQIASGGGINNLRGSRLSQNVYFARNKLGLMHGWDREAMTSDAGGGYYYGRVTEVAPGRLQLIESVPRAAERPEAWNGAGVFILGGKGMGQYSQITRIDGDMVSIDPPWLVPPDDTSVVTITMLQRNYIIIDNEFSDAGIAVQFYGTSVNHVVAGNKSTRTAGFLTSGRWYRHYQPSWYNQFLDNEISEGNFYRGGSDNAIFSGEATITVLGAQRAPNTAPLALGNVIRRNHLDSNAHLEILGSDAAAPGVRDVVIEGNAIGKASLGIRVDRGVWGVLARKNSMTEVDVPLSIPAQMTTRHFLGQ